MSELAAINYIFPFLFSLAVYSLVVYFRHRHKSRVREAMIQQASKQRAEQLDAHNVRVLDEYDRMMTLITMVQPHNDIEEISLPDGTTYHVMRGNDD